MPVLAIQYAFAVEDQDPDQVADIARQLLSPRLSRLEPEVEVALTRTLVAYEQLELQGQERQQAIDLFRPALEAMCKAGYV